MNPIFIDKSGIKILWDQFMPSYEKRQILLNIYSRRISMYCGLIFWEYDGVDLISIREDFISIKSCVSDLKRLVYLLNKDEIPWMGTNILFKIGSKYYILIINNENIGIKTSMSYIDYVKLEKKIFNQ